RDIVPIRRRSLLGAVEFSRGCGKGCGFCYAAKWRMEHLPPDVILADIETNRSAGQRSVTSTSEDFFRYGATGSKVSFTALHSLLTQVRQIPGLSFMQIDHGNISSIMQFADDELREVRRLLAWDAKTDYLWVNLGVESASGRLVAANSPGKIAPFDPDNWDAIVRESADKMARAGFFPVYSIVLGLPGETPDDIARTRKLVDYLATRKAAVFPIFHEPIRAGAGESFGVANLRADHLELFAACYEINFRQVPKLYWDNQRAGGVSWAKRTLVQMLGRGEVFMWRRRFGKIRKRIHRRDTEGAEKNTTRFEGR
ncbi:MAG: radical SAM protein, partial [Phycisphaerae bacterium]|nr:radical SAM protein [Phycisphaerae bacterium]